MCCEKLRKAVNRRSKRFSAIDFQSRAAKLDKTCVGRQMIYVLWHGAGITTLCRRWLWADVPGLGPRPVPARSAARLPPLCGPAPARSAARFRPGPRPGSRRSAARRRAVCDQASVGLRPGSCRPAARVPAGLRLGSCRSAARLRPVCGPAPAGLRPGSGYPAAWFLTGRSRRLGWGPRPGSETVPGGVSRAVPPLVLIQFPADSGYCIKLPAGSAKFAAGWAYSRPI